MPPTNVAKNRSDSLNMDSLGCYHDLSRSDTTTSGAQIKGTRLLVTQIIFRAPPSPTDIQGPQVLLPCLRSKDIVRTKNHCYSKIARI